MLKVLCIAGLPWCIILPTLIILALKYGKNKQYYINEVESKKGIDTIEHN